MMPGLSMPAIAPFVLMSTQVAESGMTSPFRSPGISRNCLRTSSIILNATFETAPKSIDEKTNGSIPPTSKPAITVGSDMSATDIPAAAM